MTEIKGFTAKRLIKLCNGPGYILVRCRNGQLVGINKGIGRIAAARLYNLDVETDVVSFIPCTLNEYINYKLPFVTQQ